MKRTNNPVFWVGLGLLLVAVIYVFVGASPTDITSFGLVAPPLGADGRCTGFPNGFLQWDWSSCCSVHDAGGSDGALASCLLDHTPMAATPLVFLACALMAACRPAYNLLQRWGWVK